MRVAVLLALALAIGAPVLAPTAAANHLCPPDLVVPCSHPTEDVVMLACQVVVQVLGPPCP